MNIKFNNLFAVLLLTVACTAKNKTAIPVEQFNHLAVKEKTIILSCIKCKCIIEELNKYSHDNRIDTARFTFYGDTTCYGGLLKAYKINHLPQKYIDSCSVDFYNMLVLTKRNNTIKVKEVTTPEAEKLPRFLND